MLSACLLAFACVTTFLSESSANSYVEYGRDTKDRQFIDTWSNSMYIPEAHYGYAASDFGAVTGWNFYARRAGEITLQVWRHTGSGTQYELIGQTDYTVKSAGQQSVDAEPFQIKRGDVLGFLFPGVSIIPFDGWECLAKRGLYVEKPNKADVKVGKKFTFSFKKTGWNPCRKYSLNAVVGAVIGNQATDRKYLDTWSSSIYIVDTDKPLKTGAIDGWQFYARRAGTIYLQVWRHTGTGLKYQLIGQTKYSVKSAGVQTVTSTTIETLAGDVFGFYFPGNSIIPFDGTECADKRELYVQNPTESSVVVGAKFDFKRKQAGWNPCRDYSLGAIFVKGDWFGDGGAKRNEVDKWSTAMYIPNPDRKIAQDGNLQAWQYYAQRAAKVNLQVFRPQAGTNSYKLIAQTVTQATSQGLNTIVLRSNLKVKKNDVIGFYFPNLSLIPFDGHECSNDGKRTLYVKDPKVTVGSTYAFKIKEKGWNPCRAYSFKALIASISSRKK